MNFTSTLLPSLSLIFTLDDLLILLFFFCFLDGPDPLSESKEWGRVYFVFERVLRDGPYWKSWVTTFLWVFALFRWGSAGRCRTLKYLLNLEIVSNCYKLGSLVKVGAVGRSVRGFCMLSGLWRMVLKYSFLFLDILNRC